MSTEIIIALVSSITALLVAILNVLLKSPAEKKIEKLKYELRQKELSEEAKQQAKSRAIEALNQAICLIQEFKDVIQRILYSVESSLDADLGIQKIREAQVNLTREYKDRTIYLNYTDDEAFHKAKNIGFQVEAMITKELLHKEYASQISDEMKKCLWDFREQLTDIQHMLRDSRSTVSG